MLLLNLIIPNIVSSEALLDMIPLVLSQFPRINISSTTLALPVLIVRRALANLFE